MTSTCDKYTFGINQMKIGGKDIRRTNSNVAGQKPLTPPNERMLVTSLKAGGKAFSKGTSLYMCVPSQGLI